MGIENKASSKRNRKELIRKYFKEIKIDLEYNVNAI